MLSKGVERMCKEGKLRVSLDENIVLFLEKKRAEPQVVVTKNSDSAKASWSICECVGLIVLSAVSSVGFVNLILVAEKR